ncbi:MAG: substrate-binding domain-containing protein, partial [Candidatus Competibacter sp.]|nr:substrate-binding domain-containing protein [Candidatus Competibacter sp.]
MFFRADFSRKSTTTEIVRKPNNKGEKMLMRFAIKSLTKRKFDMLKKHMIATISVIAISATTAVLAQAARDHITVVGAFTGVPLATAVAERFIKISGMKMPLIEANTTGGGFKSFCAGTGIETPDATTATRRIRPAEVELCEKNGVKDIIEVKFGYDALVPAHVIGGKINSLNRKDLFLAMAKDVPDPKNESKLIPNPYKTWKEINPA